MLRPRISLGLRAGIGSYIPSCVVVSHDVVRCSGQCFSSSSLDLANVRNYISLGWVKV